MNFLQLTQRLQMEAGLQGGTIAAVSGNYGIADKLARWIQEAYKDVQAEHETWLFRRSEFEFPTVAGVRHYTPVAAGITDLSRWLYSIDHLSPSGIRVYQTVADEQDLAYLPWDIFKGTYQYGSHRTQEGRPKAFTVKPDETLSLWPTPNGVFTVNGEYIMAPHELEHNGDEPIFREHRMAIVWRALMLYGAFEGAADVYQHGNTEYGKSLAKLHQTYLPKIQFGAPLI